MRFLIIFLLFPLVATCQVTNLYTFTEGSGTTLTDRKGTSNGTLAGASLPIWKANGYLSFSGDHGTTTGNWSRVTFSQTDFRKSASTSFAFIAIIRTSYDRTNYSSIFNVANVTALTRRIYFMVHPTTEGLYGGVFTAATAYITGNSTIANNTGRWVVAVLRYDASSVSADFYDNSYTALSKTGTPSGNFYETTSQAVMGARYSGSTNTYSMDFTGDICRFINYSGLLPVAIIADINNEFELLY